MFAGDSGVWEQGSVKKIVMIDLIKHFNEQSPWLFNRRFKFPVILGLLAVLAQAVPVDWVRWCGVVFLLAAVVLLYDAVSVLPQQKQQLKKIRKYLYDLELDKAKDLLSRPSLLNNVPFLVQKKFLLTICCLHQKDLMGAYAAIVSAGKNYLLPNEAMEYRCLRGRIYWEAGNIRDFTRLFKNENFNSLIHNPSVPLAMMKSHSYVAKKDLVNAKHVLESVIATDIDEKSKIPLYNELSVFEGRSGNKGEQILYLSSAAEILKQHPTPAYYGFVFHNLSINLLRENRKPEAYQVMQDYRDLIDLENVWQCLFFCNDQLDFARETGSQGTIDDAHTFRKKYLSERLPATQEIALRISELQMIRNDQQKIPDYYAHVRNLVKDTEQLLPEEQLPALLKVTQDIRFEFEKTARLGRDVQYLKKLDDFYARVAGQAIALESVIEKELQVIPPALPEIRRQWTLHRHALLKLKFSMNEGINHSELQKIFSNLEEMARLWQDKEYDHGEIKALLVLCDEFIAYRQILKGPFHDNFIARTLKAFQDAENLLKDRLDMPGFQPYMIGMAYFALKLGMEQKMVLFWFQAAHRHSFQIRHYAQWFRQQYMEVQMWIKSNRQNVR